MNTIVIFLLFKNIVCRDSGNSIYMFKTYVNAKRSRIDCCSLMEQDASFKVQIHIFGGMGMKKFIATFKSASKAKKIIFVVAVSYIVVSLVSKYIDNGVDIEKFGTPYFATTIAVSSLKVALLCLVIKSVSVIKKRIQDKKTKPDDKD